jgi:hypothetical protein
MNEFRPGAGSTASDVSPGAPGAPPAGVGKATRVEQIQQPARPAGEAAGQAGGEAGKDAPRGGPGGALAADEFVLTRDPAYSDPKFLQWFRDRVRDTIQAWGLVFKDASVETAKDGPTAVMALDWDPAWGKPPTTRDIPFSMTPIDARAAVTGVQHLAGWSKVDPGDQTRLTNLLAGETNQLSETARNHLRPQFHAVAAKKDVDQAKDLEAVLTDKAASPALIDETVPANTTKYALTGPADHKGYAFAGGTADAEIWQCQFVDSVQFEVVAPKAPTAGLHYHTVQQAADAASYLPKPARAVIKTVLLNTQVNPDDAYWAVQYKDPNFHSYMTAGAAGVVTIYPDKNALPGDNYMRGTMIHETGHTWSYQTWGQDTTKGGWVRWQAAMTSDKVSISGYAMASIAEDVSETITGYVSTKGSPKFAEYKAIVPARFAILDAEYKV